MAYYLGIDTSNYTTSTALFDSGSGEMTQEKQLLPVTRGSLGLRQNDAVFLHVRQLGPLMETLLEQPKEIGAVGVSLYPTDREGSYMPCFLSGDMAARSVSAALHIPRYHFSHQAGHIVAALYATLRLELVKKRFIAFHFSGGTTQSLLVEPDEEHIIRITVIAETLDLNAGQVVDRVGGMLGLSFPAGPQLEELAGESSFAQRPKPTMKQGSCCLSGVENQCERLLAQGETTANVAAYCLSYLGSAVLEMTRWAVRSYPGLPLVYAGGVMANKRIKALVQGEHKDAAFAPPAFSSDNAAGIAVLCALRDSPTTMKEFPQ